ncbi:MAG: hypothetical protein FWC95_02460 [Defluviitaleaceae bacterium]|nr:hypothetical protein [Defluviitaleaceae bacterium]
MSNVKDMFSKPSLSDLATKLVSLYNTFPSDIFIQKIFNDNWDNLEMFARMSHIAKALSQTLPVNFVTSLGSINTIIPSCNTAQGMVLMHYISECGLEHLNESTKTIANITKHTTGEFAVRPFIDKYPDEMLHIMMDWTKSEDEHVRRLASEGSRLAIPWGGRLQTVKKKPGYALPILEAIKDDPSEYVRKSVANNLNELSKIAPDLVVTTGQRWLNGGSKNTEKIIKHACRTMLKKAYPPVLELFGLAKPMGISVKILSCTAITRLNDDLTFSFEINNESAEGMKIRIGYDIGFIKANGQLKFKENRISERNCPPGKILITRKHTINETSSRRIYPGLHELIITINGNEMAKTTFEIVE